ncbi:nuclear pore complex protein Nup50 [Bombina bombina]|uniref:nuclear pore complex protein Nup50 n=1 Tax=Bombina bombina TaxID=8345 RepID=UPI00235A9300|nr:nuclear pore complex protein Nup50 [Bombina bombina]
MAKRIADKELTDRNWDEEDETEEAGTFSVAPADVLKTREIKKAKRRNTGSESEVSGAFKGFKGLIPSSGGAFSAFGNGSGLKPLEGMTNGTVSTPKPLFFPTVKTTSETKPAFGSLLFNGPSSTHSGSASTAKTNGERTQPTSVPGSASNKPCSSDYNKQLTSLNCSVRDWIVKHVNANPLCDLTPIFRDYEKHLSSIEQKYGNITDSGSESDSSGSQAKIIPISGVPKLEKPPTFTFSSKENPSDKKKDTEEKKPQTAPSFNFGQKVDSSVFSVGAAAGFSFSSGVGFGKDANKTSTTVSSFPIQPKESSGNSEDAGGAEEEEEPPKVVINEVKEEDAFYSKKCKLFYKKDTEFKERGVGTLHLKLMGNQKTQLLVRADTNLGNIMLNILVQPSMPCSRTGKNNVIIVCVPNPPVDEKNPAVPVTMLIRVKTTEDADELHRLILEKKEM